jgi:hypothetical protein
MAAVNETNGTSTPKRDTQNHLLFEVATEVANRGLTPVSIDEHCKLTWSSGWYLFRPQVQGSRDNGRVWRAIHADRPAKPSVGT